MRRDGLYIQKDWPPCTAIRKTLEAIYKRERGEDTSMQTKTREQK